LPFWAGLLLVAIPERAIATSRINNDVLLEVVAALFFLLLTHAAVAGLTARRAFLLGLLLGLAVWVKISAGLMGIPLLLLLWLHRHERGWVRPAGWIVVAAAPLGSALALRNLWLYGDLTGFSAFDQLHRLAPVDPSLGGFLRVLISLPNHFWVVWWKGSEVGENGLLTFFYLLMALVVIGAWTRLLLHFQQQHMPRDATRPVALVYALTVLLYAFAVVGSYYEGMVPVIQGRFLLPAMLPFVLLLVWGLWLSARGEAILLMVVVLLWGMGLFSLFGNLVPYFYYWSDVVQGTLPADSLTLWQGLLRVYPRALLDKPAFLAPLLLVLPIGYAATLVFTFIVTLRAMIPLRRYAAEGGHLPVHP
jgi:hypothetical protein